MLCSLIIGAAELKDSLGEGRLQKPLWDLKTSLNPIKNSAPLFLSLYVSLPVRCPHATQTWKSIFLPCNNLFFFLLLLLAPCQNNCFVTRPQIPYIEKKQKTFPLELVSEKNNLSTDNYWQVGEDASPVPAQPVLVSKIHRDNNFLDKSIYLFKFPLNSYIF